jgi:hypothetical protein
VQATDLQRKLAFDLRDSWQGRALAATDGAPRAVLMSVLAHTLDTAMPALCALCIPGFDGALIPPFLTSAARIDKSGRVVADVCGRMGVINKDEVIFASELAMRDSFRRLADDLKLSDDDRIELFKYAQRWVVADRRLDPNFDPRDPDAKRLTLN